MVWFVVALAVVVTAVATTYLAVVRRRALLVPGPPSRTVVCPACGEPGLSLAAPSARSSVRGRWSVVNDLTGGLASRGAELARRQDGVEMACDHCGARWTGR